MTTMPAQVFEPWSWENPGPEMPRMMSNKDQYRTGHIFTACPNPVPPADTKGGKAEPCDICAALLDGYRVEVSKWRALQEADMRVWKVNGVPITGMGYADPFPGMAPTQAHADALGWEGPVAPNLKAVPDLPPAPLPPQGDEPRATDAQVALLVRLAAEKRPAWVNQIGAEEVRTRAAKLTRAEATARITKLDTEPTTGNKPTVRKETVPAGYYALPTVEAGGNSLAFYRVDRPTAGKWAGYTFVKRVIGGQSDERVPRNQAAGILGRILADPDAGLRYGREIGQCCRCNRTLTNDESRALGIGPECRNKA